MNKFKELLDWKSKAYSMFFESGLSLIDISNMLDISTKSIGAYLRTFKEYEPERTRRKKENAAKRKVYKREWDRGNRSFDPNIVNEASIRREHEMAVAILSHEKY